MLTALRRIVQKVNATPDVREALSLVVSLVKDTISADACSIFLVDESTGEYVLAATDGLKTSQCWQLRLKFGEGLVGLVGERGEPINLVDAPEHARYRFSPEVGDTHLKSFLGVPITHSRELMGILIVQQEESRRYDEVEESFLVTLCAQLAGAIAHAQATGSLWEPSSDKAMRREATFAGKPGSPGVAIGQAVVVYPMADLDSVPDRIAEDPVAEVGIFNQALEATKTEINRLHKTMKEHLPTDEASLFEAYLRILESGSFVERIKEQILEGNWAQGALKSVIKQHIVAFESMEDAYLRERAADMRDLGQRLLSHLQETGKKKVHYPEKTILIGDEISPALLVEIPEKSLIGIVSVKGSSNSHVAILARALGVPAVMGVSGLPLNRVQEQELIVDGYYGQIYLNPSMVVRQEFQRLADEERELETELEELRDLPAETLDSHRVSLYVNTGLMSDVSRSLSVSAEGVGLYRTEVPFMVRDRFPTEEEQRVIYRQLLNAFAPRPVMLRTLDIGGDKPLPYFPLEEQNPFLGWRGIRVTLDHPEIFLVQVRAMMRANEGLNNCYIMLPMICNLQEVEESQRLLAQAHEELLEDGYEVTKPNLGVMIEVPSAVYQARELAKRVDFLSVGSNDLTQYLLAVDRNNVRVANLYDSLHPAVLRAMMSVVEAGHSEGKRVSICGEMAGDPVGVILLLAMGFDALSMTAMRLPRVKWIIRTFTLPRARKLLDEALSMDDAVEVRCHIELALEEAGLGGLLRAGR